jgi:hypothetical protein
LKLIIGLIAMAVVLLFAHCNTWVSVVGRSGGYFSCLNFWSGWWWLAGCSACLIAWGLWDELETSDELDKVLSRWRKK